MKRTEALKQSAFKQDKIANFSVFNSDNLVYLTGFSGATALLIPQEGESTLYVSSVNYEQAKAQVKDVNVEMLKRGENLMDKIADQTAPAKTKKLAVDALSIESYRALAKAVGGEDKIEVCGSLIRELRKVKDKQEIESIQSACKIADIGMQTAYETIKPGISEQYAAAEIEYAMRKKGSYGTAFDTIIASGVCSAFPHGGCTNRIIHEGDLVVVDLGAIYKFYRSDLTRTIVAGKASQKQVKIYETVLLANENAYKTIKPNVLAKDVDASARKTIEEAGFGDFFVHNLGHGVGLEIHEQPILSPDSKDILAVGNVVTDEPGIYLPGYGGVRIEDTVLVTQDGAEKLTVSPYTLKSGR